LATTLNFYQNPYPARGMGIFNQLHVVDRQQTGLENPINVKYFYPIKKIQLQKIFFL
jgi:hypothetical protein